MVDLCIVAMASHLQIFWVAGAGLQVRPLYEHTKNIYRLPQIKTIRICINSNRRWHHDRKTPWTFLSQKAVLIMADLRS